MLMEDFSLRYGGTQLFFGINSTSKIEKRLNGIKNVLIVTGRSGAEKSGALADVKGILEEKGIYYEVHKGINPNPTVEESDNIARHASEIKAETIISIGGGSVIDASKVASVVAVEGGTSEEYIRGKKKPRNHLSLIAINTTHGTGTEIDRYAVLSVPETEEKIGMSIIYPDIGIDNPKYTITLPRKHTILTSLDALYHSIEAFTGTKTSPFIRDLAATATRLIAIYLPKVLGDENNLEYRYHLLYSSMLAGIAIDLGGTHIIHLIEHVLSGMNPKLEHAAGLAILGPKLMKHVYKERPALTQRILFKIAPDKREIGNPDDVEKILREFQESVEFNYSLGDYGFDVKDMDKASEISWKLMKEYWGDNPPFSLRDKEELKKVLVSLI